MIRKKMDKLIETKQSMGFEAKLKTAKGNIKWCRAICEAVVERGIVIKLRGIFQDITERKRTEEALRQDEAILAGLFLAAPVGICFVKDKVYQSINRYWCEHFGYSEEDIIGKSARMLYESDSEYKRVGRELYNQLWKRGFSLTQCRLRRKDGLFYDVLLTAAPLQIKNPSAGVIVVIKDITEYKQAENKLKVNEKFLNSIIENIPNMIFVKDAKELKFLRFNKAGENLLGYSKEELYGKTDYDFFSKDEAGFLIENSPLISLRKELKQDIKERGSFVLKKSRLWMIKEILYICWAFLKTLPSSRKWKEKCAGAYRNLKFFIRPA
jgi:PAS domain S-box-containing protein